jgi:site-specific DNA recombinase
LVAELDRRKIVTKRRATKFAKYQGGIPFTYGPLAYFLKNGIYIGETHHGDKWFKGEHEAILDLPTFEQVQQLLKSNTVKRRVKFSESGALLQGKLFDDKGNRMGPSFCSKNGVRYRFYVSTALRGRKHKVGSITRISAPEVEGLIERSLSERLNVPKQERLQHVERVIMSAGQIRILLKHGHSEGRQIDIPWKPKARGEARVHLAMSEIQADQKLLKSIVRAHAWLNDLSAGRHTSIEDLAAASNVHPKAVRQGLRLAFLAPELTASALNGEPPLALKQIPKCLPLAWHQHRRR